MIFQLRRRLGFKFNNEAIRSGSVKRTTKLKIDETGSIKTVIESILA